MRERRNKSGRREGEREKERERGEGDHRGERERIGRKKRREIGGRETGRKYLYIYREREKCKYK